MAQSEQMLSLGPSTDMKPRIQQDTPVIPALKSRSRRPVKLTKSVIKQVQLGTCPQKLRWGAIEKDTQTSGLNRCAHHIHTYT